MIASFLLDEKGTSTIEALVGIAILAAIALVAFSNLRSVTAGASTITTKAISAVNNAGTVSSW